MVGGEIHIMGDIISMGSGRDFGDSVIHGKIFHKGKLIVNK